MTLTSPPHMKWFVNSGNNISTPDGNNIEIWVLDYALDDVILSSWAKHFRTHYCLDEEIDFLREGYGYSRADYLNKIKFPDISISPGPSIRSGDFSEILVSDYLEYILGYWVPRTRYGSKVVRNESSKGCDTLAFKIVNPKKDTPEDTLAIFEAKAQFSISQKKANPRLQDAINDSIKDEIRRAESLNAIKQHLFDKKSFEESKRINRFQNPVDRPFKEISGAAALFSSHLFDSDLISQSSVEHHPNHKNLKLIVIHGENMMALVHELYRRAADEA